MLFKLLQYIFSNPNKLKFGGRPVAADNFASNPGGHPRAERGPVTDSSINWTLKRTNGDAPKASPWGEAVTNRLFGTDL
jgi:hypothetical protein